MVTSIVQGKIWHNGMAQNSAIVCEHCVIEYVLWHGNRDIGHLLKILNI